MSGRAKEIVTRARIAFESKRTRPIEWRIQQLRRLHDMVTEQEQVLADAVYKDLRKAKFEVVVSELIVLKNEIVTAIKNVQSWAEQSYVSKNLIQKMDSMYMRKEPLGVVLIMGAWNYPVVLLLNPIVAAIASGNCAVLKPSDVSENTAAAIAKLIPQYMDKDCFPVYLGGIPETTVLLEERFDHIFYTGSTPVGKIVMTAAAKHLTPVTLELGGKSPCYVGKNVHMDIVCKRLLWGKLMNGGQTCVAPDYILCHEAVVDNLITYIKKTLKDMLGDDPKESPDLARIVNDRNFARISKVIDTMPKEKLVVGGERDIETRYIAPTVYKNVTMDDEVMASEIFGPILPIITVANEDEATKIINRQEKPLALYIFSNKPQVVENILEHTTSGGVTVNDTIMHMASHNLPFGGVGFSGTGSYHGKWGFDRLSHERAICWRKQNMEALIAARYMPYTDKNLGALKYLTTEKDRGFCAVM
ncbi:unnamed protein product [Clavelina lepadiformis]|uniref:Aldehyde dehydrogenase n=2 Tax=Clavelina lepadiformis TaxID=159417 RepID=A0ABP0GX87_CLALP